MLMDMLIVLPTVLPGDQVGITVTEPEGAQMCARTMVEIHVEVHGARLVALCMLAYRTAIRLTYVELQ